MSTISVSPGGSIQNAVNTASAGDTVKLLTGVHVSGGIVVDKAITLDAEVGAEVQAASPGQGTGVKVASGGVKLLNLKLKQFNCGIGPDSLGAMSGFKDDVVVRSAIVEGSQYSCWIGGNRWLVEGSIFRSPRWWNGQGDCDYTRMFGSGHVFRGNWCYGANFSDTSLAPASGSDYAHVDGIQYYGNNGEVLKDCLIENNTFEDFHQGLFLCDEKPGSIDNLTVRNNFFHGKNYVPAPGSANYNGRPSWGICIGKGVGASRLLIENNTVVNVNNGVGLRAACSGIVRKNVWYGPGPDKNGLLQGTCYDPSCTTPGSINIDNITWFWGNRGQGGFVGVDQNADPRLDINFFVTNPAMFGYGMQAVGVPVPTPDPTPTPEPTPEYALKSDLDAALARIKALEDWRGRFSNETRQFRDRGGIWRTAPSKP